MNPLPIGSCGAVRLTLTDSTGRDAPRTPQGRRKDLPGECLATSSRIDHHRARVDSACP
jgi:hypothetical protein